MRTKAEILNQILDEIRKCLSQIEQLIDLYNAKKEEQ